MIEGLKVTVSGTELKQLCVNQAEHHRERAQVYAGQLESMERNEVGEMQYSNGDPKRTLRDKLSHHENAMREMHFVAEHLVANEEYLLDDAALYKLGISKRGW